MKNFMKNFLSKNSFSFDRKTDTKQILNTLVNITQQKNDDGIIKYFYTIAFPRI